MCLAYLYTQFTSPRSSGRGRTKRHPRFIDLAAMEVASLTSKPLMTNCGFRDNRAGAQVGGIACANGGSARTLVNSTLTGNTSDSSPGGGEFSNGGNISNALTVINSIFWNSTGGDVQFSGTESRLDHRITQIPWTGSGTADLTANLTADPMFADLTGCP